MGERLRAQRAPENSEFTSFAETAKKWYERHKPKIRVALGVTLAVGLGLVVAAHRQERQDGERYDAEDIGDRERSRSPTVHPRTSFVNLPLTLTATLSFAGSPPVSRPARRPRRGTGS